MEEEEAAPIRQSHCWIIRSKVDRSLYLLLNFSYPFFFKYKKYWLWESSRKAQQSTLFTRANRLYIVKLHLFFHIIIFFFVGCCFLCDWQCGRGGETKRRPYHRISFQHLIYKRIADAWPNFRHRENKKKMRQNSKHSWNQEKNRSRNIYTVANSSLTSNSISGISRLCIPFFLLLLLIFFIACDIK